SEKTHQVDTLAEAEIDAQQPKPESAQPTQAPAREEERRRQEVEDRRRLAEAEAEKRRQDEERRKLAELVEEAQPAAPAWKWLLLFGPLILLAGLVVWLADRLYVQPTW